MILPISLIILGESLIFSGQIKAAAMVHGLNLIAIVLLAAYKEDRAYQALILVPLFRLLNIAMPVFSALTLYSYALTYSLMLIPIYLLIRRGKFSPAEIGLTAGGSPLCFIIAAVAGLSLGYVEYQILHPEMLTPDRGVESMLTLSIIMIFFVGFVEEFVFRSALQTVMEDRMGSMRGLLAASLLFGIMYSGYGTLVEIFFGSCAGFIFGSLFQRTRSLPLITLAHGIANISLFLIVPAYMGNW